MKNQISRKLSALLACVVLGSGALVQAGCEASSSDPIDGDDDRSIMVEEITLADVESLAPGEAITLDLEVEALYMIAPDALKAGADRIVLRSSEGDITVFEWREQSHALGVEFEPYQALSIAGDPQWFGTLSDEQILQVEKEPVVVTSSDRVREFYWCIGKRYGCVVIITRVDQDG